MNHVAPSCPRCGASLSTRALDGLCPDCLIRLSLRPLTQAPGGDEPAREPPPHSRLGDFELLEEIGRGGMGVVWRARQMGLNRIVALKTIRSDVLGGACARQRFQAEAETAATLSHANIVPVFEVGETEGRAWFAMRLVEGGTLTEHLADGRWSARHCPAHRTPRLPWPCRPRCCPRGADLLVKLARAVHHAHQHGVLHGDLKPGNILLDEEGEPHIADFGLARWLDRAENAGQADEILGTPSYMAPEQANPGTPLTIAADVYSLGAIFYHILTGRPPFMAETPTGTIRKAREEDPAPPRTLHPDVDPDLEAICLKCLAKDPAARYASAASLADDLDRWRRAEGIRAHPSSVRERLCRWGRRRPGTVALVVALHLVALAGLAGILTQWYRAEGLTRATRAAAVRVEQQLVTMQVANGMRSVESGDVLGALPWFAEAARLQPTNPLHRLCLASLLRAAPSLERAWQIGAPIHDAAWTPDGARLVAGSEHGHLLVIALTNSPNQTDAQQPPVSARLPMAIRRLSIAPDGTTAAVGCADGQVFLIRLGDAHLDALPGPATGAVRALAFSPDGHRLAAGGEDRCVRLWSLPPSQPSADDTASKGQTPPSQPSNSAIPDDRSGNRSGLTDTRAPLILPHDGAMTDVAFTPDGAALVSTALDGTARFWRAASGESLGAPVRSSHGLFACSVSPDGAQLVTAGAEGVAQLWTVESRQPLGGGMNHLSWIKWVGFDRAGRFVATGSEDNTARLWDATDGHPLTPPLRHDGRVTQASFDTASRRLATGGGDQTVRLWVVPDGTPVGAPLRHGGAVSKVAWQPGGRLLLTASADGLLRIWDPEPARLSSPLAEGFTVWNAWFAGDPDRFIASGPGGHVRVFHAAHGAPASALLTHPAVVDQAALSPDGARLLTACRDAWARVWDLSAGREIARAKLASAVKGVAWHPDGRAFAAFLEEPALLLLDAATGQMLSRLETGRAPVLEAAFSPDRRTLAAGCQDGSVWIWQLDAGAAPHLLRTQDIHAGVITRLAFSPDSTRLLTAGTDGVARLVAAQNGAVLGEPMAHTDALGDARFDSQGRRIVTASDDGSARVWDAASGRPLGPPLRPQGGVAHAQFSPDGRFVLTRNPDAVEVWHAGSGTLVLPHFAPDQPVAGAGFSPDSRQLWVVSEHPRLYALHLTPGDWTVEEWQFAARFLSCRAVDATGGLTAWSPPLHTPGPRAVPTPIAHGEKLLWRKD